MDDSNNDNMFQSESYNDVLSLITRQVINGKSVLIYNSTASKNIINTPPPVTVNPVSCIKPPIVKNVVNPKIIVRPKKMMFI